MHYSSQTLIDRLLFAAALKAVSEEVRILLMCLVSKSSHLSWMCIWLTLLCLINILLVLHIFEAHWVLRLINELCVGSYWISIDLSLCTLSLIYVDAWFGWFLRSFPWSCSWVLTTWLHIETVLWYVLHHTSMHTWFFHLQLLQLKLLLKFHSLLLLGTKIVSAVENLSGIAIEMNIRVWLSHVWVHHHWTRNGSRVHDVWVWIWVFSGEESSLSVSFSFIDHSLVWTWAFTFSKMHVISETSRLPWLTINLLLTC